MMVWWWMLWNEILPFLGYNASNQILRFSKFWRKNQKSQFSDHLMEYNQIFNSRHSEYFFGFSRKFGGGWRILFFEKCFYFFLFKKTKKIDWFFLIFAGIQPKKVSRLAKYGSKEVVNSTSYGKCIFIFKSKKLDFFKTYF
jgi:hypothetical protein